MTRTDLPQSLFLDAKLPLFYQVLGPPSPPTISGNKATAQEPMSSSVITAVQEEGGDTISSSDDQSIDDGLLEFAIAAYEYLEQDSSPSEIVSSPAVATPKYHHQADHCFVSSSTTTASNHHHHIMLTRQPKNPGTKMTLQPFNDAPFLETRSFNHADLQSSETMILNAISQRISASPCDSSHHDDNTMIISQSSNEYPFR